MAGIAEIDRAVTLAINGWNAPWSDAIWQVFSNRVIWYVLYAAIIVLMFVRLGWKRALLAIAACVLCVVCCDQLCNLVKVSVARLRPCRDPWMLEHGLRALESGGGLYGFFSGHAANAMGFAACSSLCFLLLSPAGSGKSDGPKPLVSADRFNGIYSACIIAWAFLVGLSRVFVGMHYLGDVLVGFAVGDLFGVFFARIAFLVYRRL